MRKLLGLSIIALLTAGASGCTDCNWCQPTKMFAKAPPQQCYDPCAPAPIPVTTAVPCCQ